MIPSVRANDLVFNGGAGSEGFTVRTVKGMDGVDDRTQSVPRAQAHGDFVIPGFLGARIASVAGLCFAKNPGELGHYRRQLTGLGQGGQFVRFVFEWLGETVWADGQVAGKVEFDDSPLPGLIAEYFLPIRFPDPRLYGDTRLFASSALAYHYGNFPAAPVFTVSGARVGGYSITGSDGSVYASSATVVVDHPHVIDTATGFRTVDGVVAHGNVTSATFKQLPGGAQVSYSIVGAGLTLAVAVMDTFV